MINMLKADFYRMIRGKGIYIAIFILLLFIGIDIYQVQPGSVALQISTGAAVENEMNDMTQEELQSLSMSDARDIMLNTKGYALDRDVLACNMNLYYIFIFVVAIVIAVEFSGNTIKNTLSSAISRHRYFLSKILFVNICCLVIFFLNTYVMYFANILFNNKNLASSLGTITEVTLLQLPPILALISILTGLAFMLKKTSIFNTVAIPLVMVFQLLLSLFATFFKIKEEWLEYELQTILVNLTDNPSASYVWHSYFVCAVIIAVFYLAGYLFFKKTEIK